MKILSIILFLVIFLSSCGEGIIGSDENIENNEPQKDIVEVKERLKKIEDEIRADLGKQELNSGEEYIEDDTNQNINMFGEIIVSDPVEFITIPEQKQIQVFPDKFLVN